MLRLPFVPELPLRTERLQLRAFRPDDFEALLAFHSLPDSVRYVPFEPRSPGSMRAALERKITSTALRESGDLLEFAVTLDQLVIGDVLLALRPVEHATLEVGYLFDPRHTGHGYATETVRRLLGLAFDDIGAHRVVARIDSRNQASIAVCERVDMRAEAHLVENEWFKGEWSSEVDYAMLEREWTVMRPAPSG